MRRGLPPQVRSALAKLDGIETSDVEVDYGAKTATVDCSGAEVKPADLVAAFEGTRFTAVVN